MTPPGNFKLVNVHRGLAFIAGHPAIDGSTILVEGVVGTDLSIEEGYRAARLAGLAIIASLKQELGDLDRVTKWLRAVGYVRTAPDFHDNARVVNGFSDLIVEIWGDVGRHARSAPAKARHPLTFQSSSTRLSRPPTKRMGVFGELQTIPPQSIIARSDEDLRRPWQARRRRSPGRAFTNAP